MNTLMIMCITLLCCVAADSIHRDFRSLQGDEADHYCSHRQSVAFNKALQDEIFQKCDQAQVEQGMGFHPDNLDAHGARKLFEQSCSIPECEIAYERLLTLDLVPNCLVELGDEVHNARSILTDTHNHCLRRRM